MVVQHKMTRKIKIDKLWERIMKSLHQGNELKDIKQRGKLLKFLISIWFFFCLVDDNQKRTEIHYLKYCLASVTLIPSMKMYQSLNAVKQFVKMKQHRKPKTKTKTKTKMSTDKTFSFNDFISDFFFSCYFCSFIWLFLAFVYR